MNYSINWTPLSEGEAWIFIPGGVALDAGEGRGARVGRYEEDSGDGGRGVQHDRVRLAFCDINC